MSIVHSPDLSGPAVFGCAQAGCRRQECLVRQHERLVHYVLRRQVTDDVDYADLLQAGRIGLWRAVLHFDTERGVTFSTYAVIAIQRRMWQAIRQARRRERPYLFRVSPGVVDGREPLAEPSGGGSAGGGRSATGSPAAGDGGSLWSGWMASAQSRHGGASVGRQPRSGALLAQRGVAVVAAAHLLRALATSVGARRPSGVRPQSSAEPHLAASAAEAAMTPMYPRTR